MPSEKRRTSPGVQELQTMRAAIRSKKGELDRMEEDRSSSFSSGSPLLPASESESEKEEAPPFSKATGVPPPVRKEPPRAVVPPRPESSALPPSPAPTLESKAAATPKVSGKAFQDGKPKGRGGVILNI